MSKHQHKYDWLFIALIYNHKHYDEIYGGLPGYRTMESQKNHLFNVIEDIKFNSKIKIVLVENRLSFEKDGSDIIGLNEVINIVEKTDARKLQTVKKNDNTLIESLTKPENTTTILKKLNERFPAKKNAIITFGHGSIFGINLVTSECSNQSKNDKEVKNIPESDNDKEFKDIAELENFKNTWLNLTYRFSDNTVTDSFLSSKGISFKRINVQKKQDLKREVEKVNKFVFFSNKEIRDAIKQVWPDEKLNILVMYNCLMQNLYTQYELRDCIKYLVAPESGICYPGYNFTGVFTALLNNTAKSDKEIANLFLGTIRDDPKYDEHKKDIEETWKISCVELDEEAFDKIKLCFSNCIGEALNSLKHSTNVFMCINNTLNQCFNYANFCLNNKQTLIDLLVFLRYMKYQIKIGFPSLTVLAEKIEFLITEMNAVYSTTFTGKKFFSSNAGYIDEKYNNGEKSQSFGFVLQKGNYPSFSIQNEILTNAKVDYYPSFLKDTGFENFYQEYSKYNSYLNR